MTYPNIPRMCKSCTFEFPEDFFVFFTMWIGFQYIDSFYVTLCLFSYGSMQWLESETLRLSHLRDRASDLGRRKEYPFLPFELMNMYLSVTLSITSKSLT